MQKFWGILIGFVFWGTAGVLQAQENAETLPAPTADAVVVQGENSYGYMNKKARQQAEKRTVLEREAAEADTRIRREAIAKAQARQAELEAQQAEKAANPSRIRQKALERAKERDAERQKLLDEKEQNVSRFTKKAQERAKERERKMQEKIQRREERRRRNRR